jgi:hypothetical protein
MSLPGAQQTRHFEVRLPWDKRRGMVKGITVPEWMYCDVIHLCESPTDKYDSTSTHT